MIRIQKPQRHRSAQHVARRLTIGAAGGVFAKGQTLDPMVFAAAAAELPGLAMPVPEDRTRILISSAMSALFHILIIGGIALLGYIAKQAVEEIIPVVIFSQPVELPGARDAAPVPIPKMLSAPMASAVPLAMAPLDLAAVPAPKIQAPSLDLRAPTTLDLATVTSAPLAAQANLQPTPSAADIREVQPLEINAADLVAPKVERVGPSETAIINAATLVAPKAFESLSETNAAHYKGAATAVTTTIEGIESGGALVATGVSAEFLSEGISGGDPTATATVQCRNSAFVQRYIDKIVRRTRSRWALPLDANPDDRVTLRIAIDYSGSIAVLEMVESTSTSFAESAMTALRSAAPFGPLDDTIRCLAEETRKLTFTNPLSHPELP
jgi:hypothetical protein